MTDLEDVYEAGERFANSVIDFSTRVWKHIVLVPVSFVCGFGLGIVQKES